MSISSKVDSPIVLGMQNLHLKHQLAKPEALADWIEARVDQGLNWFDHADIYGDRSEMGGNERLFGNALNLKPELKHKVRIITKTSIVPAALDSSPFKVKHYDSSPSHISQSIDQSLKRLGVERIDHFLLHRPDPLLDPEITARALEDAIKSGKIGAVGVSNHLPAQWRRLQAVLDVPLAVNQFELSIARSSALFDGRWDACCQDNMQGLAYSPLFGGRLFEGVLVKELMCRLAEEHGLTPGGIALAWLKRIPGSPVPVVGTSRSQRINDLVEDSAKDFTLGRPDWFALLESARAFRVL